MSLPSHAFSCDQPSTLYKEVLGYCTHNNWYWIWKKGYSPKIEWVFVRLVLLLLVLSCGFWELSSGSILHSSWSHSSFKWRDHSLLYNHISSSFHLLLPFLFHIKTLKHVLFLVLDFQLVKYCYWLILIGGNVLFFHLICSFSFLVILFGSSSC